MSSLKTSRVAGDAVQLLVGHMRREDELVPVFDQGLLQEILDDVTDAAPVRVPQHEAGSHLFLDREEVQALAQHAVVPLLRLLETMEVGAKLLLPEERGAVDALEHLAAFVTPPVRAGHAEKLEMAQPAGAGDVGAPAEVEEGAVTVHGDDLVFPEFLQPFELEGIVGEEFASLLLIDDPALEGVVRLDNPVHPLLNRLQLLGREGRGDIEVIVVAVSDRRTEADPRLRDHLTHRRGEDVGGGVAQDGQGLRIVLGEEADGRAIGERLVQVDHLAVDDGSQRGPGQAGSDFGGKRGGTRPGRERKPRGRRAA